MESIEYELDRLGNLIYGLETEKSMNNIQVINSENYAERLKNYNDRLEILTKKPVG